MSYNSGGMPIGGQFAISSPVPLDCRYVVTSADELTALISEGGVYDGLEVWFTQSITYNSTTYSAGKHVLLSDGTIKCLYKKPSSTSNTSLLEDLDSSSTEASAGSFLTQVTITDGKISGQKTASNAATSDAFSSDRTISITGSVTGSGSSTGSGGWTINTTTNHNHDDVYINVTGDTMTGPLAFANNTYNNVGDDVCFGDVNASGMIGLKSLNDETVTGIVLKQAQGEKQGHIKLHFKADKDPDYFEFSHTVQSPSFNASSDARLKENFQPLTPEKSVLDLPTYKFDFINGLKNQIGCKAQDLQKICPEIVNEGSDGYLSIQESKIVYLLLEEVKKLRQELDELKKR